MCTTCGCSPLAPDHGHDHPHEHPHDHEHAHDHAHDHAHAHDHDHSHDHPHDHVTPAAARRLVQVEADILGRNRGIAAMNRSSFEGAGILALNLVSGPGAGKTTLLARTVQAMRDRVPVAVIEGDLLTDHDAERIRAAGAPAYQVNTGRGCHLDAAMVRHACDHLEPAKGSMLFIENVGNLVCPAEFDLGEAATVVILSITEGEDKPLKYAPIFAAADLMILHKIDLAPYLAFDTARCREYARQVKPDLEILEVSSTTGVGFEAWLDWLNGQHEAMRPAEASPRA